METGVELLRGAAGRCTAFASHAHWSATNNYHKAKRHDSKVSEDPRSCIDAGSYTPIQQAIRRWYIGRYYQIMNSRQAMDFIRYHGVVLQSAKGLEPSLAARIAGEPIRGSWWGHPKGHDIYKVIQKVDASKAVLICALANNKITYIHRRLWPAFVRLANRFPRHALNKVEQVHLPSGRHQRQDIPFPKWVPISVLRTASRLSPSEAAAEIEVWLQRYGGT